MHKTLLAAGILVALCPLSVRAATIYSDNFSSDADRSTPAGFTITGSTPANDYGFVVTPGDYQFGVTANGANFVTFQINGPDPGLVPPPYPGEYESTILDNANVGTKFLPATTYTLTYEIASSNTLNTSLEANNVVLASTTESGGTGSGTFVSGPTVTFDTLTDPSIVGQNIGFETDLTSPSLQYSLAGNVTDYVLTATSDVLPAPEPSTYALLGLGALALAFVRRRALAQA